MIARMTLAPRSGRRFQNRWTTPKTPRSARLPKSRRRLTRPEPSDLILPAAPLPPSAPVEPPLAHLESERQPYDENSGLNLYLKEVGRTPLLTPAEEIELAAKIKKGSKKARKHHKRKR